MAELSDYGLTPGLYTYERGLPVDCHGFHYRLHCLVQDIPVGDHKCLVEAIDGPDRGLKFTVTVVNFLQRYDSAPEPAPIVEAAPEPETPLSEYW